MIKQNNPNGHILALSGGVGGAKLALGLARILAPEQLTIGCNTGDDFHHLGLYICPDLDTVTYTLAGRSHPEQGWGLAGESWQVMSGLNNLDAENWFNLGDQDIATHLLRRQWCDQGLTLTQITQQLCLRMGIAQQILPMTDDPVATFVNTDQGDLAFQHYFVREQCLPKVNSFYFKGIDQARIQSDLEQLLRSPELAGIVICPSNPFVSIDPILHLPGMRQLLKATTAPIIAVSPIVGGKALKGPAAKMMAELGQAVTVESVAIHYNDILDGLVLDTTDQNSQQAIETMGIKTIITNTVMQTLEDKIQLAQDCLNFAKEVSP